MAVLYLLTLGLFLVGWIVDLFTMREQVDQCNDKIFENDDSGDFTGQLEDRIDELEDEVEELRHRLRKQ